MAAPKPLAASPENRTLDSAASGSVNYKTTIAPKKIDPKAKTTYTYTFTKPGYKGRTSYGSAVYRCDNYYGSSAPTAPAAPSPTYPPP